MMIRLLVLLLGAVSAETMAARVFVDGTPIPVVPPVRFDCDGMTVNSTPGTFECLPPNPGSPSFPGCMTYILDGYQYPLASLEVFDGLSVATTGLMTNCRRSDGSSLPLGTHNLAVHTELVGISSMQYYPSSLLVIAYSTTFDVVCDGGTQVFEVDLILKDGFGL